MQTRAIGYAMRASMSQDQNMFSSRTRAPKATLGVVLTIAATLERH